MNLLKLSWKYLWSKPLNLSLNILLFAFGAGIVVFLLIAKKQMAGNLNNSKGIDLVVGAKGSPMQLILSSIYQIDYPTGNISLLEAEKLTKNRFVKTAVPLALGDAYDGIRIVGTTTAFIDLYQASVAAGALMDGDMEVCLGSRAAMQLGLQIGDEFVGQHGLAAGGYAHDDHGKFKVVGILQETGKVIDRLIIATIPAIWELHEVEEQEKKQLGLEEHERFGKLMPDINLNSRDSLQEITAVLIAYRSPMGAMQLPRYVNSQTNMQAASPAFEMARLLTIIGVGIEVFEGFAYVILLVALLSMLMAMYNALKDRRYDLAIMRALGASKSLLFRSMVLEGMMIAFIGMLFGVVLGHVMMAGLNGYLSDATGFSGMMFYADELIAVIIGIGTGALIAVLPAMSLYRVDVSKTLSES
jgi:putative ABC transport system permease protein